MITICFSQEIKKDSLSLYYPTNGFQLSPLQKEKINQLLSKEKLNIIQIKGYTDYVGKKIYNQNLSERRCRTVIKHLKTIKDTTYNYIACGEIFTTIKQKNGIPKHRKISIYYSQTFFNPTPYQYLNIINHLTFEEKIRLKNIQFKLATDSLISSSIPELNQLYKILKDNPKIHIQIEGHVCCGDLKEIAAKTTTYENQWLSEIRAKKISNFLIKKGIHANRLTTIGFGFLKPLKYPEENEEDKQKNRRIEIRVIDPNYINKIATLKKGNRIVLKNINFDYGLYRLTPDSFNEIENIYQVLKENPKIIIAIEGHVCCGKNEEALGKIKSHYNTRLSNNRAQAVRNELLKKGISEKRIFAKGFGFSKPIYFPEQTPEDQKSNRRIEAVIIGR